MIISCPECAGPFEVRDEQIAALVQVACPHCSFRMILDFAAANDPGLVEAGMKMASGYRSAADYRAATAGATAPQAPAGPSLVSPEPEPETKVHVAQPVAPEPEDETTVHVAQPAAAEPEPETTVHVAQPAVPEPEDETTVHVAQPAAPEPEDETTVHVAQPAAPEPEPEDAIPVRISAPAEEADDGAPETVKVTPAAARAEPEADAEPEPEPDSVSGRRPPHTPPGPAKPSQPSDSDDEITAAKPKPKRPPRPALENFDTPADDDQPRMSGFGVAMVAILVLMAGGLVAASLMMKNTPDPRPLLEDLYRQHIKGQ